MAEFGDSHLRVADLYLLYGKALLENAISQNSVLGKSGQDAPEEDDDDEPSAFRSIPFHYSIERN